MHRCLHCGNEYETRWSWRNHECSDVFLRDIIDLANAQASEYEWRLAALQIASRVALDTAQAEPTIPNMERAVDAVSALAAYERPFPPYRVRYDRRKYR